MNLLEDFSVHIVVILEFKICSCLINAPPYCIRDSTWKNMKAVTILYKLQSLITCTCSVLIWEEREQLLVYFSRLMQSLKQNVLRFFVFNY